jgi:hypothetical protein
MQMLLEKAVAVEDGMGYMEPPRQYQPVRHCLGRVLLSAGRPAEAEQVARFTLRCRVGPSHTTST